MDAHCFQTWKPIQKCFKPAFFLMTSRRWHLWGEKSNCGQSTWLLKCCSFRHFDVFDGIVFMLIYIMSIMSGFFFSMNFSTSSRNSLPIPAVEMRWGFFFQTNLNLSFLNNLDYPQVYQCFISLHFAIFFLFFFVFFFRSHVD